MDQEVLNKLIRAGQVSVGALQEGAKLVKPGAKLMDVARAMEQYILDKGLEIAFPANISLNSTAAHDSARIDDERTFTDQDVVKLDIGAHQEGYCGDNAVTIDLSGKHTDLIKASREALLNVEKILAPGITLGEIGKTVQETIESHGFNPVRNLAGHTIEPYTLHAGLSIPNYDTKDKTPLEEGMVCAIEPFATTGSGFIEERGHASIHALVRRVPVRSPISRRVQDFLATRQGLPFSERWVHEEFGAQAKLAMAELKRVGAIRSYPPLVDRDGGLISQAEHLFIIGERTIVTTKKKE